MASEFWIIAGINGAGKTTFCQREPVRSVLGETQILNTDDVTLALLKNAGYPSFESAPADVLKITFISAANRVEKQLAESLTRGANVGIETVLSTDKLLPYLDSAKSAGVFCGLVYVTLTSPELAIRRVATRVASGGHDVPSERLRERWTRSHDRLAATWPLFDLALLYDNSDDRAGAPPQLLAVGRSGKTTFPGTPLPSHIAERLGKWG